MTEAGWRPGLGDNDFLGWSITCIYFAAAGLCAWAANAEHTAGFKQRAGTRPVFWFMVAGLLVCLGFNKQLDLQEWVAATGKQLAASGAFGLSKGALIGGFLGILATVALVVGGVTARYIGRVWREYLMAFVGLAYLGSFVLVRAGSRLPGLDQINHRHLWSMHLILELGSLVMIGVGAARALGRQRGKIRIAEQNMIVELSIAAGRGIRVTPGVRPAFIFSDIEIGGGDERAREAA